MTLQRADRLKEPPVVGEFYLVPAIRWVWGVLPWSEREIGVIEAMQSSRSAMWWPVWGSKHDDVEFFGFAQKHHHVDPRFFNRRHWARFGFAGRTKLADAQVKPLNHIELPEGPPKPVLRKMRCTSSHSQWEHDDAIPVVKLNEHYSGQRCARGKRGFVCPHKLFPLGSVQAIDGVVTCPLHGLRIDAAPGKCIGPKVKAAA